MPEEAWHFQRVKDKLVRLLSAIDAEFPSPNCRSNITINDVDQLILSVPIDSKWYEWVLDEDSDFDPDRLVRQMRKDLEALS